MKKILIIIMLVAIPLTAYAAVKYRGTSEGLWPPGTSVVQIFDNVSTVGTTSALPPGFLPDQGTMQIVVNGSPVTYDISVDASIVSSSGPFVPILSLTEGDLTMGHWALKPLPHGQVVLNNMSGSGSFDVYLIYRGN